MDTIVLSMMLFHSSGLTGAGADANFAFTDCKSCVFVSTDMLSLLYGIKFSLGRAEYNIRLFIFLLSHRADCLLSNDLDTLLPNFWVSRLKRIGLIYDSHEYFTEVPELVNRPRVQKVWKRIEEYVLPKMKEMITVNESIANLFREKYGIRTNVIRNIPMRKMLPAPSTREELGLDPQKNILVLQGSGINIHRGSEELVDAMEYLDDC